MFYVPCLFVGTMHGDLSWYILQKQSRWDSIWRDEKFHNIAYAIIPG